VFQFGVAGVAKPSEAVEMILQANRDLAEADLAGSEVIREPFKLTGRDLEVPEV
jgi:hypothetical protein